MDRRPNIITIPPRANGPIPRIAEHLNNLGVLDTDDLLTNRILLGLVPGLWPRIYVPTLTRGFLDNGVMQPRYSL